MAVLFSASLRSLIGALSIVGALETIADAGIWDLSVDFSTAVNPNGAWTLGVLSSDLTFQPFNNNQVVGQQYASPQISGWSEASVVPYAMQNISTTPWLFGSGGASLGAGEVMLHPAISRASVVRWTAPATGHYSVNAAFRLFELNQSWESGYHIQVNQKTVEGGSGQLFSSGKSTATYAGEVFVMKSEVLDIVVDMGTDGRNAGDGTVVSLLIERSDDNVLAGDFDGDERLTLADLNQLNAAIRVGTNLGYDLDPNNNLDHQDRVVWVTQLKRTYFGDSNLDNVFDSTDLVSAFAAGKYEDGIPRNTEWSEGDWNGDADFDSSDLILAFSDGGYDQAPRPSVSAVPEPVNSAWILVVLGACSRRVRRWSATIT